MSSRANDQAGYLLLSREANDGANDAYKETFGVSSTFKKSTLSFKFVLALIFLLVAALIINFLLPSDEILRKFTGGSRPVVHILNGSYAGIYLDTMKQDIFLGMPYAVQPVGSLRFRHPQSLNESWEAVHNASDYGPQCPGYGVWQPTRLESWLSSY
jgi:hypothetical protein